LFDLAVHLKPDQIKFLSDLASTKDYNEYMTLLRNYVTANPDIAKIPEVAKALARK